MEVFYTDHFVLPLPKEHRFPMAKYAQLRQRVVASGLVQPERMIVPEAATDEQLLRAHAPDYLRRAAAGELSEAEVRRIGFPWSRQLIERSRRSSGATIAACRSAFVHGIAVNLAGGTHHAFRDAGEGYCVFNDAAVAARAMQAEGLARRVAIIDTDVHQGNGTAAILRDDPNVFTFSIHGAKNFPLRKELSDLDIALSDGTGDAEYLEALEIGLRQTLARSGADLVIFLSGADPFFDDKLGRLKLSKAGLRDRDQMVFSHCRAAGLPMAVTMGGGYARQVEDTVDIHFQTISLASRWMAG
jgi:acetoin utilization deacetylase AcuC-like enzyme